MKVDPIKRLKDVGSIKKLLADSPRDSALFIIRINTNLRASDILNLTIEQKKHVVVGGEIEITEKKTGKKSRLTLNEEVVSAIQCLLANYNGRYDASDMLFQGQRGTITVKTLTRLVKKWCGYINLKGNFGAYTLRKTWGYHQRVRVGTSIPELMVMFNHTNQKQTLDYLCIQPEEIKGVYMKLSS